MYVYTLDGSTPNKFYHKDQLPEVIEITRDTVLKIRSYKAGMIDSPILVYKFKVLQAEGMDRHGFGNMKRQKEEFVLDNDHIEEGFEDLFGGSGFASYYDQGIMTTPNLMNESSFNTPHNN